MKRLARAVLVLVLIMEVGHATPAHALAGLRAITCCARGCDHGGSLADAMRCCGVQAGDQLAVTTHAGKDMTPTFVAHAVGAPLVAGEQLVALAVRPTPPRDRPPPVFLLIRSLRL